MPLIDQVQKDMVAAMKAKDEARLSALRMIKAALMKHEVDSPKPLDEAAEMQILKTLIKQRTDAAEMFRKARPRRSRPRRKRPKRMLIESLSAGRRQRRRNRRRHRRRDGRDRRHVAQADGRGDEGRAGEADRERPWTEKRSAKK